MRNVDSIFNKEGSIEYTMKVNLYYKRYRERTEIDIVEEKKWSVILGMLWFAHHNPEINWKIEEVKLTRYPEKWRKQWRLRQGKLEWKKIKEKEKRKRQERNKKRRSRRKKFKNKKIKKAKKAKNKKDDKDKESCRKVEDIEWERSSSEIRRRGKEVSDRIVLQVDQGFWEESEWENANKKNVGLYNRFEEEICTKKREDLSLVQRRKRESTEVYTETNEKEVYLAI